MNLRSSRIGVRLEIGIGIIIAILAMMVVLGNVLTTRSKQQLIDGLETFNTKEQLAVTMKSALLAEASPCTT